MAERHEIIEKDNSKLKKAVKILYNRLMALKLQRFDTLALQAENTRL